MTDRIVIDPHPGLVDRIAEALFPWLRPSQAAIERQHEPGPEPRGRGAMAQAHEAEAS